MVAIERDEVDIFGLWRVAWANKVLIAGTTLAFGVAAAIWALLATPIYRAQVTITLVDELGAAGLGGLTSQLSGLASLAGVNIGGGMSAEREARAVLKSRYLVERFIEQRKLIDMLSEGGNEPLTLWEAVNGFRENVLDIRDDVRLGVTTVSVEWTDAATASQWANAFVGLTNEVIRTRTIEESQRNIAYLNSQISKTDVVEMRRVMYNLIEGEMKKLMIANGRVEYAFKVVDPAVPPELRAKPRRTVMVLIGLIMGFLAGSTFVMVRDASRRRSLEGAGS